MSAKKESTGKVKKALAKENTSALTKEIERAISTIILYPVSSSEEAKNRSYDELVSIYNKSSDAIRQHILMTVYETIARFGDVKAFGTSEYFRTKTPKAGPGTIRMNVYKDMFNYNHSIEGLCELIGLLSEFEGKESAKLLTRLFTYFCAVDSEASRMMRNMIVEALGESNSPYALESLLTFSSITDNENLLARLSSALADWDEKLETLALSAKEKEKLKKELHTVLTRREAPTKQYG